MMNGAYLTSDIHQVCKNAAKHQTACDDPRWFCKTLCILQELLDRLPELLEDYGAQPPQPGAH